jgi:HK97 gp10 family phage protein
MARLQIEGVEELVAKLKKNVTLDDVKRVVRQNGSEMQSGIQDRAEFKKGYQTGATHQSVRLEFEDGGLTANSGPTTEYSPYLEHGTRFMEAQPFVKPAFDEQKKQFKKDLDKLTV